MPRSLRILVIVAAMSSSLQLGCGEDGTAFSGLYVLDSWTENLDDCGSDGSSVLEDNGDTHLYIKNVEFFGQDLVSAGTCPSAADCEEALTDDSINLFGFVFDRGSDDDGWVGTSIVAFEDGDEVCQGEVTTFFLTGTESAVRIESETRLVSGFGKDADDFCDTDEAEELAEALPCDQLEVVTANRAGD